MKPFTPEMAVDLKVASDVQISPDGKHIAFCVAPSGHRDTKPTSTIFVVPTTGDSEAIALTGSEHNNVSPRWAPDSQSLAFISDRPHRGVGQLHVIALNGGQPQRLTSIDGGVQSPAWSPDGKYIYVTARRRALAGESESKSEIYVASEQPRPRAIAVVPRSGGTLQVVGPPHGHVWSYAISPDGKQIAAVVSPTERLDDTADQSWVTKFSISDPTNVVALQQFMHGVDRVIWSPDGQNIVLINGRRPDHLHPHVHIIDANSGDIQTLPDRDLTPVWADYVDDHLFVLSTENQQSRLDSIDPSQGDQSTPVDLGEVASGRWITPPLSVSSGGSVAFLGATSTRPADVFFRSSSGEASKLTDLNTQLDDVQLAEMEEIAWSGKDGLTIHGWLLRPQAESDNGPFPLITNVHGGPTMAWGNWFHGTWHDWAQVLVSRGYAVFLPNPRGSTGKGQSFAAANRADLGGADYHDVMLGIDHLIECGVADASRLGIGGWSYGGFLTALSVVRSKRFKAAVAGAAVTNWASKVGTTDIRPLNEWNFPNALHRTPDPYWIRSPIRYLRHAKTPTLIVHGQADDRVPVSQGMEFYLGLKAQGVETDFVTYPRQAHAFHERAFQLDLLNRICDWFDRYLKT